jgi:acetyltransferase-like isoleucine patch superfamily enzyme
VDTRVSIGRSVLIYPGVVIAGPTITAEGTFLRPFHYMRDDVLTGRQYVIGHSTEVKPSISLDRAKAPHKAYVGDSILGRDTNLGAGTWLANVEQRTRSSDLEMVFEGRRYPTGLCKLGTILSNGSETGCKAVCNPGALIGKGTVLYSGMIARRCYESFTIVKGAVPTACGENGAAGLPQGGDDEPTRNGLVRASGLVDFNKGYDYAQIVSCVPLQVANVLACRSLS